MPRFFLQLSFNGKNYHGWQLQANAHSVQAEVNKALSTLLKQDVETLGCGRTDTGVHAKKFFIHFDTTATIAADDFLYHLNRLLPFEIATQRIIPVANDAHARYDATSRTYCYYLHATKNPFLNDYSHFFPYPLNVVLMNEAAAMLFQYNEFGCFSKSRTQVKTNTCKITTAEWSRGEEQLIFKITADRFLRNMVRAIVGTLLEVGENHITLDDFKNIIEKGNRSGAGVSVPAHALFLEDITYPFISEV